MLRYSILFLLLLIFHLPGVSQQRLPVDTTAAVPADSVVAVHRLFELRREGSGLLGIGAGATMFAGGVVFGIAYGASGFAAGVIVTSLYVAVPLAIGIAKRVRFSHRKEAALLAAYQRGQPLPKKIRRRLREKHFQSKEPFVDPSIH